MHCALAGSRLDNKRSFSSYIWPPRGPQGGGEEVAGHVDTSTPTKFLNNDALDLRSHIAGNLDRYAVLHPLGFVVPFPSTCRMAERRFLVEIFG